MKIFKSDDILRTFDACKTSVDDSSEIFDTCKTSVDDSSEISEARKTSVDYDSSEISDDTIVWGISFDFSGFFAHGVSTL